MSLNLPEKSFFKSPLIISLLLILVSCSFFYNEQIIAGVPQVTPPPMKLGEPLPANIYVELAKIINPAVVNISTSSLPKMQNRMRDPMLDLLEQFYGIPSQPRQRQGNKPQQMSLGTGFIIREDGLIITNNHVIEGADIINVQLTENANKTYEARLIGSDKRTDIALIKIESKEKFPVAALGSSKDLQVGEFVAAFGNPYGHGHTMTQGIISSKGREIGEINKFPLLQTDASINPGNSGGPLVNMKGYVVGVNSAIDARAQGIGFAIPIDDVKAIIPQLEQKGKIQKGYLGAALGDIDPQAAESYGIEGGAVIVNLDPKGPAAKAGAKPYDLVTEFNGKKIKSSLDLMDAVADSSIGKEAKMKVNRNNKTFNLNVVISERPDEKKSSDSNKQLKNRKSVNAEQNLGFAMMDLDDQARQDWGYPEELKKPIVIEIKAGSLASMAGIRVGDIILDINGQDITTADNANKAIKKGRNTLRLGRGPRVVMITIDGN